YRGEHRRHADLDLAHRGELVLELGDQRQGLGHGLVELPVADHDRSSLGHGRGLPQIDPDPAWPDPRPGPGRPDAAPARRSPAGAQSSSAAMPGSVTPWMNSSDAPPPVDTCEIRSTTPIWSTAAALSPPPTTDRASRLAANAW